MKRKLRPSWNLKFVRNLHQIGMQGPKRSKITRFRVESLKQYLDICYEVIEQSSSDFEVFFRGQDQEYFLTGTDQISLIPTAGRPSAVVTEPKNSIRKAYFNYFEYVVRSLLESRGIPPQEINEIGYYPNPFKVKRPKLPLGIPGPLTYSPIRHFLDRLYNIHFNPLTFEATLQHYGFPTLNLDVTFSPLVALSFATQKFRPNEMGALEGHLNDKIGAVYVLSVPIEPLDCLPESTLSTSEWVAISPRYVHLFNVFYDNDSRPRRQGAVSLTEIGHRGCKGTHQLNAYSQYIKCAIEIMPKFYQDSGTKQFLDSLHMGRLFPDKQVDILYTYLREADASRIVQYKADGQSKKKDPLGKFEYMSKRKILLVGSEVSVDRQLLQSSWMAQQNMIEIASFDRAKNMIADRLKVPIDVVICCEADLQKAYKMCTELQQTARELGRIICFVATYYLLGQKPRGNYPTLPRIFTRAGVIWQNTHDSDLDRLSENAVYRIS